MSKFGLAALACYAIHAAFHLFHGRPAELLWACHLGAALVGAGLLYSSATTSGIGLLFLCMGTPLWLLDLAGGGEFYPTSCFTHLGGLAIGLYGARRLVLPPGTWWKGVVALISLILICRLVTPPGANVNVAFAVYPGWDRLFPNHPAYLATMTCLAAGYFFVSEFWLRRWLSDKPSPDKTELRDHGR
ncbi:MAG: hypothetical protein WAU45_12315 [Blastocatellia bacterium]